MDYKNCKFVEWVTPNPYRSFKVNLVAKLRNIETVT